MLMDKKVVLVLALLAGAVLQAQVQSPQKPAQTPTAGAGSNPSAGAQADSGSQAGARRRGPLRGY